MSDLSPVTLRFSANGLERAWRAESAAAGLRPLRFTLGLVIALFVVFVAVDRTLLPELAGRLLAVRVVVCALLLGLLAATWLPSRERFYSWIVVGAVLVTWGGIVSLQAIDRELVGFHWVGILLALLAIHGLFRPRFPIAVILSLVLIWAYHTVAVAIGGASPGGILLEDLFLLAAAAVGSLTTYSLERIARERFLTARRLEEERRLSEQLLLNILPGRIARRLKAGEKPIAERHRQVTVLFADIVDFTALTTGLSPDEQVRLLDDVFRQFDHVASYHDIEKVKTVGDACMMVAGLTDQESDHAARVANAALDMREWIRGSPSVGDKPIDLHIGIATGPVVAGVTGRERFSYDLWGDVVNTASRIASLGGSGRIQVTEDVVRLLGDRYLFRPDRPLEVEGKGTVKTWTLEGHRVLSPARVASVPEHAV